MRSMGNIPLITAAELFPLLLVLALFLYIGFTFAIIYHFIRFGIGVGPKIAAFVFFVGTIFLFFAALLSYTKVDISHINIPTASKNVSPQIKQ